MEKKRIRYSKEFKQNAVLKAMCGVSALDILRSCGYDLSDVLKNDAKYASKLLYKWKKEFFRKRKNTCLTTDSSIADIENEIVNLCDDSEKDVIMEEVKNKIFCGLNSYKKLSLKLNQLIKK